MKTFAPLKSRSLRAAVLAVAAVPFLAACGSADAGETIAFAAIPSESSASLESNYSAITELIEQETGVDVEFQNASDYAAVIEGQRAGQIDIASYGPFSYVIAKDSGMNIDAVASLSTSADQQPAYTSLAYVRADSEIQDLSDLEGKTVCFVDAASTSGYLVPMHGLMKEGIDLKTETEAVLAGGHDASLLSLASGSCDAAFAHDTMLNTLETSGQVKDGALKPVWESKPIPEDPIALNLDTLEPELAEQITTVIREKANKPALVEAGICASEQECVLPEEIEYGYLPVEDTDFNAIRDICAATNADACHSIN